MDRGRWKKLIRLDDDQDGGWVSVSSGTGSPGQSWTKGHKTVVVVVPYLQKKLVGVQRPFSAQIWLYQR